MTDEEIIKALMCHFNEEIDEEPFRCVDCPLYADTSPSCTEALKSYAINLINRQKAEIEKRLTCEKCFLIMMQKRKREGIYEL